MNILVNIKKINEVESITNLEDILTVSLDWAHVWCWHQGHETACISAEAEKKENIIIRRKWNELVT